MREACVQSERPVRAPRTIVSCRSLSLSRAAKTDSVLIVARRLRQYNSIWIKESTLTAITLFSPYYRRRRMPGSLFKRSAS